MSDLAAIVFVVVADHDAADRLVEDVRPWLEQGLARRFVIVAGRDVLGSEQPLGRWADSAEGVACYRALAEDSYARVRVVAYQELPRGSSGDPHTIAAARALADAFLYRKAPTQRLVTLNVLVPDERTRDLPPDLLELSVSANVVVAPEDRESPRHAGHPLIASEHLRLHGLMNLFTLAALWRHQQDGPLDEERTGSFNEIPHVVMMRAYGRIARAPMLVERIAAAVFKQRRAAPWAAEAVGGVRARDPAAITQRQAERFIDRHRSAVSFTPAVPRPQPKLRTVGVLQAFLLMFSYVLRGLRSLPSEVLGQVSETAQRAAGEFAQRMTFGEDSRVHVEGALGPGAAPADQRTQTTRFAAMLLERAGGAAPTPPAAGDAWQELRAVSFALHDGSEFPEGFERPSDGVITEVITEVGIIAPDPVDGPFRADPEDPTAAAAGQTPLRVNDAMAARQLLSQLETRSATQEADRLCDWVAQRETSLTWRLAEHVTAQFAAAESLLGAALQRVEQGAANLDGTLVEQTRSQLLRGWRRWFVFVSIVAAVLVGYLLLEGIVLSGAQIALVVAGWIVIWLLGWTLLFLRYLRRMFQLEHRRDRENLEYVAAVTDALHAADGLIRLGSAYEQLQDWAEIIGWMLHHPEGDLDAVDEVSVPIDLDVPASHRIGRAGWDERSLRRLAAIVGRHMFGRSWLSNLFVAYRSQAMDQLLYELGLDRDAPQPDPDWDLRTPSPRTFLLEQLARREHARVWTEQSVTVVQELLNDVDPNELLDTVEDAQGTSSAPEFLYGILADRRGRVEGADLALFLWTNRARMNERPSVSRLVLWSSNPLPDDVREAAEGEVARIPLTERSIHDVLVVRADLCAPVPFTDLTLFVEPSHEPLPQDPVETTKPW